MEEYQYEHNVRGFNKQYIIMTYQHFALQKSTQQVVSDSKTCSSILLQRRCADCSRSSDPFNIVTYYIKWVTTSWIDNILCCITTLSLHLDMISARGLKAGPRGSNPFIK